MQLLCEDLNFSTIYKRVTFAFTLLASAASMYGQPVPQKPVEAGYNKLLAAQLDSIFNEDQQYREQSIELEKSTVGILRNGRISGK